jgi:pimeloyl-ACP methyl ester carboxylesterase
MTNNHNMTSTVTGPSNDAAIAAHLVGEGQEHVLVMHDWNGDHSNYDPVIPYLDRNAFTYAFVDLRGYGASKAIAGRYTVNEISSDCLAVADRLGWQRFHVIGHSMTGMATERLAADAPKRIKSAIAVCPMSAAGSPAPDEALAFFATTTLNDDAFRRLIRFVSGGLSDQWIEAKLRQNRATVSPACRDGYLRMFSRSTFVDEVQGLATPFLVAVAEHDPGIDEAAMRTTFLAWHKEAELAVIPNCGHYPMQECPPYFAALIENYLRKHAG